MPSPRRSELHTRGLLREQMPYAGTAHAPQAREWHPLKINAAGDIAPALHLQAPHVQTSPSRAVVEAFPAHLGGARSNLALADATGFADGGNEWETWSDADYSDEELRSFQARFDEEDRQMAALDGHGADTPPVPCEQDTADAAGFEDGGNEWETWSDADYSEEDQRDFDKQFEAEDRKMAAFDARSPVKPPIPPKPAFVDGSWRPAAETAVHTVPPADQTTPISQNVVSATGEGDLTKRTTVHISDREQPLHTTGNKPESASTGTRSQLLADIRHFEWKDRPTLRRMENPPSPRIDSSMVPEDMRFLSARATEMIAQHALDVHEAPPVQVDEAMFPQRSDDEWK